MSEQPGKPDPQDERERNRLRFRRLTGDELPADGTADPVESWPKPLAESSAAEDSTAGEPPAKAEPRLAESEVPATDAPPPIEEVDPREGDTGPLNLSKPPAPPPPFGSSMKTPPPGASAGRSRPQPPAQSPTQPPSSARLPRHVNQVDVDATRVSPAAYTPPQGLAPHQRPAPNPVDPNRTNRATVSGSTPHRPPARPPAQPPPPPQRPYQAAGPTQVNRSPVRPADRTPVRRPPVSRPTVPSRVVLRRRPFNWNSAFGCLLRTAFLGLSVVILVAVCVLSVMFVEYYRIASTLPSIADLRQRASQFETTRILDRNGDLLYEILDPNAGRRTYIPIAKISPYLVAGTIATEDKGFYDHPGFDVTAIVRAFWQNYQTGSTVSGASTITQQLARALLFTPEERSEQTYNRKLREAILAAEITRRYTKDDILELYLNENYYGNLAYGVEAASETYFGVSAEKLDLAQASFLAGLPQAPAVYDVYTNPEATFARQKDVLALMYEASREQNCIRVSNSPQKICIDPVAVTQAAQELRNYQFNSPDVKIRYPHWVNYIRSLLEAQYDPQTIYRAGFTVYTTLDPELQDFAQSAVSQQVAKMKGQNADSGALVAIQPSTGEILAMVGSADFYNEAISGQVNMAVSPRQPGSSIKPLTYLAAFEKGWTPATLIWDVPSEFPPSGRPDDLRPPYVPANYDGAFHGPVTARFALANSYNIPAVKTLSYVGIYDDPSTPGEDGLLAFARRMGITTLTRPDYGLSLTLGGGEVSLLELAGAYSIIANRGMRVPLTAITKITDYQGTLKFERPPQPGEQTVRPELAYLITSIISDNSARRAAFGPNSVLELPFQAAVKTGTTNDFRDNWTIGFTPDLVVGVWVGNPDYTPMKNTTGLSGAAPIWSSVMQNAIQKLTGGNPAGFTPPAGVNQQVICAISGTAPSQWCPQQRSEVFAIDRPPLPASQDLWQKASIDTWTGLLASPACSNFVEDQLVLNVTDQFARKWIRQNPQGKAWADQMGFQTPARFAPTRECKSDDPHPSLEFAYPRDRDTISASPLDIYIQADAQGGFDFWQLDYALGENPVEWQPLARGRNGFEQPAVAYSWDLIGMPSSVVTLRLYLKGPDNAYAERQIRIGLQVPTPTPTVTPTPTDTPTPPPTETPTPTNTLEPSLTPSPSETSMFPPLPTLFFPFPFP
jgi:penicillin-binding protein 1C